MRNLQLLRNVAYQESLLSDFSKCFILNEPATSKGTELFIFSKCLKVYLVNIKDKSDNRILIADLSKYVNTSDGVIVVGCNYIFGELYIILNTGLLITILIEGGSNEVLVKELNTSDITHVSWSPDFERTVLITANKVVSVLSIVNDDYETLHEVSLQDHVEEQNKFVNVGWGSVETQFRGSEGKFSKCKPPEPSIKEDAYDTTIHICWKQNGTAFAVSYLCLSERTRLVKIFSQDGWLLNITKNIAGLSPMIDWWPSRNLITAVQKLPNKKVVCFLEENALRHGDFQVSDDTVITGLHWNSNGSILAFCGVENDCQFVALWTTSNYKWYQKQKLEFKQRVVYLQWDIAAPNRLHVVLDDGVYRMYEWCFQVTESSQCNCEWNLSLVAVINNKTVNLTPYKLVCQPPSIPHSSYTVSSAVNAIIFPCSSDSQSQELNSNTAILYLSNDRCLLVRYEDFTQDEVCLNFGDADSEIEFSTPLELSAWLWLQPHSLYFGWSRSDGNYFCVSCLQPATKSICIEKMMKLDSLIIAVVSYERDVIVHTEDGSLFLYQNEQLRSMNIVLLEPCFRLQVLNSDTVLGLSEHRNLYLNDCIKWRDVVSFYWKSPFLVVVTMDNQLLITKVDFVGGTQFNEVLARGIEPKSYLVTVVEDQVLLETERGNLEVIQPRPFSIFKMEKMLEDEEYFEVFKMLRKQRINLNVIFDHDPAAFLKNVDGIVNNITDPIYLTTFITELENENVARNMFPWKYKDANDVRDKLLSVCEALATSIKQSSPARLSGPLIAALVRQGKLTEAAHQAIEYNEIATLCHLADPIAIYRAALASFDLPCALKIVEHSKLDPSEYLPFIHELQQTEENYRRFRICDYLENYAEAVKHLIECAENERFEECVAYISKHNLQIAILPVFDAKYKDVRPLHPRFAKILTVAAEKYYKNHLFEEAAMLFERAKLYARALSCYINIGDWFSAVSMFKSTNTDATESEIYTEFYDMLHKQGQYEDAGFIAYHFLTDCDKAVESYLAAKKFCHAINAAKGLRKGEFIEGTIRLRLEDEAKAMVENMRADADTIESYVKRLLCLRERNKNRENNEDDRLSCVSIDSSDSGSVSSFGSRASSVSSSAKRIRRQKRKLWNLKEGNPREEPALLNALRETIQSNGTQYSKIVPDLFKGLLRVGDSASARELESEYNRLITCFRSTSWKAWPREEVSEEGGFQDIQIRCPPDISTLTSLNFSLLF